MSKMHKTSVLCKGDNEGTLFKIGDIKQAIGKVEVRHSYVYQLLGCQR